MSLVHTRPPASNANRWAVKIFFDKNLYDIKWMVSYTLLESHWVGILTEIGSNRSQFAKLLNPGGTENEHETDRKHA